MHLALACRNVDHDDAMKAGKQLLELSACSYARPRSQTDYWVQAVYTRHQLAGRLLLTNKLANPDFSCLPAGRTGPIPSHSALGSRVPAWPTYYDH